MDPFLEAAIDEEDGGVPHELGDGPGVEGHKGPAIVLQDRFADLCICGNDGRAAEDVRFEHFPVPAMRRSHQVRKKEKTFNETSSSFPCESFSSGNKSAWIG